MYKITLISSKDFHRSHTFNLFLKQFASLSLYPLYYWSKSWNEVSIRTYSFRAIKGYIFHEGKMMWKSTLLASVDFTWLIPVSQLKLLQACGAGFPRSPFTSLDIRRRLRWLMQRSRRRARTWLHALLNHYLFAWRGQGIEKTLQTPQ